MAFAGICEDTITAGDFRLELLGEQLVLEEEDGVLVGVVLGYYLSESGRVLKIDCSGQTGNYSTLGTAV